MYLIVDSCDDGCPDPHANGEAAMEVLMEKQGLDNGCEEEKDSIDIAMPVWITLILGEIDHQPVSRVYVIVCVCVCMYIDILVFQA